jgi:hypothetical protein
MKRLSMMVLAGWLWTFVATEVPARDSVVVSPTVVALEFVDDHGRMFEIYPASSESTDVYRAFLEAKPASRYGIRARNLSGDRVGIVIAVDGRNIISGERSELGAGESMYVLEAYQTATYEGWRTSEAEVRRFYFTNVDNSYASRIGDESAIGVIAAAVFEARPEATRVWRRSDKAAAAPEPAAEAADAAGASAARSSQAGTGFGEGQQSRAIRVAFSPAYSASQRSFFKYEWSSQLCARGVKSCRPANRFWPESRQRFVPLPPGEHH